MEYETFLILLRNSAEKLKERGGYNHGVCSGIIDIAGRELGYNARCDLYEEFEKIVKKNLGE